MLAALTGCGSGSGSSAANTNQPPIANIRGPGWAAPTQVVTLDGSASSDPENAVLSYRWLLLQKPAGSAAELQVANDRAELQPDLLGTYRVTLVVNDGTQDSEPANKDVQATDQPVLDAWQSTTGLEGFSINGAHDSAAFAWNGYMYVTGGQYRTRDRIQRAPIHGDGTLGAWVDMVHASPAAMLPSANQDHLALVHQPATGNAMLYVIGGWNGGALAAVHRAPILPDGTIGTWVSGPSLLRSRHGHGGMVFGNRLWVFAGWSAGAIDLVESAPLAADGSFAGGFVAATSLPQQITFPAAVADAASSAPGPWVLGGENPYACPNTAQDTVYRATGSPVTWQRAGTLPEPLFDLGAVFTRNTIILTGGAYRRYAPGTTNCVWQDAQIRSAVYLATLDPQGQLGPWREGPTLPAPRADHTSVLYGNHLYVIGGRSTALDAPYPTAVWFARVW